MPRGPPLFARIRPRRLPPQIQGRLSKYKKLLRARLTFSCFSKQNLATTMGLIKSGNEKKEPPPRGRPILGEKNKSYTRAIYIKNHRSCGLPGLARLCPVLRCHPIPFGGVSSRAGPQEDVHMLHANSLKLLLPGNAAVGRLIGSLHI